jgi:hypothetical protein
MYFPRNREFSSALSKHSFVYSFKESNEFSPSLHLLLHICQTAKTNSTLVHVVHILDSTRHKIYLLSNPEAPSYLCILDPSKMNITFNLLTAHFLILSKIARRIIERYYYYYGLSLECLSNLLCIRLR